MRYHLWYEDIRRVSVVSWTDRDEAAEYGRSRNGVPVLCGAGVDNCNQAMAWRSDHGKETDSE